MKIDQPYCDWGAMPFKDKRKGSIWLCRACDATGKGKNVPKCPCKPIVISGEAPLSQETK